MSKTRVKPEVVELPERPTAIKISEIATGVFVLRINQPFNLSHLAEADVGGCFLIARTGKSAKTLLGSEMETLAILKQRVLDQVKQKYPKIAKHVFLTISAEIFLGVFSPHGHSYYYVQDVRKLQKTFQACGMSAIPLRAFIVHVNAPSMWIRFQKQKDAWVAAQFGQRPYLDFTDQQLLQFVRDNPVLQRLKAYVCETATATAKYTVCRRPLQNGASTS